MTVSRKMNKTKFRVDQLPEPVLAHILSFLPDTPSILNLALTKKDNLKKIIAIINNPNKILSTQYPPNLLTTILKQLDKVLKTHIDAAKAKEEIKNELNILVAHQRNHPRPSIRDIIIPSFFAPPNPDLDDTSINTYKRMNAVMSKRLKHSQLSYLSPSGVRYGLFGVLYLFIYYIAIKELLPKGLNISTYLPQDYSTVITVSLAVFLYLATFFRLPDVVATLYAQKKEKELTEFTEQPLDTMVPTTYATKKLTQQRNQFYKTLKKKSKDQMENIEELPSEVNKIKFKYE